jgi:Spy/CpxP family protein refolding chaperone
MNRKWIVAVLIFLTVANVTALAALGYRRWCRQQEWCRLKDKTASKTTFCTVYDLDQMQKQRMLGLRKVFLAKAEEIQKALAEERRKLADFVSGPNPEQKSVFNSLDRIGSLQTELQKQIMTLILEEKSVLDSGQQKVFMGELGKRIVVRSASKDNWFETMQMCSERICPMADTTTTNHERR